MHFLIIKLEFFLNFSKKLLQKWDHVVKKTKRLKSIGNLNMKTLMEKYLRKQGRTKASVRRRILLNFEKCLKFWQ